MTRKLPIALLLLCLVGGYAGFMAHAAKTQAAVPNSTIYICNDTSESIFVQPYYASPYPPAAYLCPTGAAIQVGSKSLYRLDIAKGNYCYGHNLLAAIYHGDEQPLVIPPGANNSFLAGHNYGVTIQGTPGNYTFINGYAACRK